jgi:hypothetical protein
MPLACCGDSKPNSHRTKKLLEAAKREGQHQFLPDSLPFRLPLFQFFRARRIRPSDGAIAAHSDLFRLNSSSMRAATWSELSLIRIQLLSLNGPPQLSLSPELSLWMRFPIVTITLADVLPVAIVVAV